MKAKEVRKFSEEELQVETKRQRTRMFELRNQAVSEKIEDTSQFSKVRRDIARLLTESNSRKNSTKEGQQVLILL